MTSQAVKGKIVYSLSLLMVIFIILTYIAYGQFERTEKIRLVDELIEKLALNNLELFKNDVDFFGYDLSNEEFFEHGRSLRLAKHDTLLERARSIIKLVEDEESFGIDPALWHIDSILLKYDSTFKKLVVNLKKRGYKGQGLEGKLRDYAHEIQELKVIKETDLLTLRRYEKNFLLRDDTEYAEKFMSLVNKVKSGNKFSDEAILLINKYQKAFEELVQLSTVTGIHSQTGLKGELNRKTSELIGSLNDLSRQAETQTLNAYNYGMNVFVICAIVAVASCFLLIVFIAKNLK